MGVSKIAGVILILVGLGLITVGLVNPQAVVMYWTGQELSITLVSPANITVQAGSTFDIQLRFRDIGTVSGWDEKPRISVWDYGIVRGKDDSLPYDVISSVTNATKTNHETAEVNFLPSNKQSFDKVVTITVNTATGGFMTKTPFPRQGVTHVFVNTFGSGYFDVDINMTITAPPQPQSYTLTTSVSPSGSGSVSPASGVYASGTLLWMTASPSSGYRFSSWSGDLSGVVSPTGLYMTSNRNVAANFELIPPPPTYTLTTVVSPSGSGVVYPSGGTYNSGASVSLMASPLVGSDYAFYYWSGDASGMGPSITIVMNSNKTVIANFIMLPTTTTTTTTPPVTTTTTTAPPPAYVLDVAVSPIGGGVVTPDAGTFDEGITVNLLAQPAVGYTFGYWSGDVSGFNPSTIVTMDSDKHITANFDAIPEPPLPEPAIPPVVLATIIIGVVVAVVGVVLLVRGKSNGGNV